VSRVQAQSSTIRDLIDRMFGGSAEALVMGLLDTKQITPAKLAELQKKVEGSKP
jgi:predicted transcriptional regulator